MKAMEGCTQNQELLTRGIDEHDNHLSKQAYQFKDSPLGRIPVEWEVDVFKNRVDLVHGHQFRCVDFTEIGLPVIKIGQVTEQGLDLNNCTFVSITRAKEFEKYRIQQGDVLMALTGATLGKVCRVSANYTNQVLLQNYRVGRFEPIFQEEIHKIYFYYMLQTDSLLNQVFSRVNSGAQGNVGKADFERAFILLPPYDEQTKIAEILSTVDQAIEQTEALIAKQQRIKAGLMQDLLTRGIDEQGNLRSEQTHKFKDSPLGRIPVEWDVRKLRELGDIVRGASPRPKGDPRYYGYEIPRLMVEDVTRDGKLVTPKVDFLTKQGAKLSRPMPAGSLTVVCSGTVGVPSFLAVDACIHDGFLGFARFSKICLPELLYYIFIYEIDKFDSSATHGGIFTNLTTEIFKEFQVICPDILEQEKIVGILEEADHEITGIEFCLAKLRSFKTALMQDLLTGKKRVIPLLNETEETSG